MERLRDHPAAKVAPVCQGKSLVTAGEQPASALLPLAQLRPHVMEDTLVFLGLEQEAPVWGAACRAGDASQVLAMAEESSGQVGYLHRSSFQRDPPTTCMAAGCGSACDAAARA